MARPRTERSGWLAALLLALALPAYAQEPAPASPAPAAPEPQLVFAREVFTYPTDGRRDPFRPLAGQEGLGPRFEDLQLRGVIYSPTPGRSMVLLIDAASKKNYRARRGDLVGNARVLEIGPQRVLFGVEEYGVVRQEVLELKRKGAEGGTS